LQATCAGLCVLAACADGALASAADGKDTKVAQGSLERCRGEGQARLCRGRKAGAKGLCRSGKVGEKRLGRGRSEVARGTCSLAAHRRASQRSLASFPAPACCFRELSGRWRERRGRRTQHGATATCV